MRKEKQEGKNLGRKQIMNDGKKERMNEGMKDKERLVCRGESEVDAYLRICGFPPSVWGR